MARGLGTPVDGNALLRLSVTGGLIIGALHLIVQVWIVYDLLLKAPFVGSLQYIMSALVGDSAFAGGISVAIMGLFVEFILTTVIAFVFVFLVYQVAFVRRNVIISSLAYGFVVFVIMNFVVVPLSAAPPLPAPPLWLLIEIALEHILLIGLPLGILLKVEFAAK